MTIGVVADARGSRDHLQTIRAGFVERGVELVVSLGGMGRERADIEAALSALAGSWYLLALPGDRESFPAHRQAVVALTSRHVLDGSKVRRIRIGQLLTLLTLPGAPDVAHLLAADQGCLFTGRDSAALTDLARSTDGPHRLLVSHTPPRQSGPRASDRSASGIHIGDRDLADAVAALQSSLVVHGLVPPRALAARGSHALSPSDRLYLGAGAADGLPDLAGHSGSVPLALVIEIETGRVTWQYLEK